MSHCYKSWMWYFLPGDVVLIILVLLGVLWSAPWQLGVAQRAEIWRDGVLLAEFPLDTPRRLEVKGKIGYSVIEIQPGKARVAADPGPRQYCVRQGWLTRAGAIAICAPSHLSLRLTGPNTATSNYDSLNY